MWWYLSDDLIKIILMKKLTTILLSGMIISNLCAETAGQKAETAYTKGIAAEKAGDVETARTHYANAVAVDPNHANARFSLGQLNLNGAAIAAKGREEKLGAIMIPIIQLDAVTVREAFEALALILDKESEEGAPNFVIQDPGERFADRRITLNLKNIPTKGVIKFMSEQAGAKVRYDKYAVVVSPR